jgi:hypothetical protein
MVANFTKCQKSGTCHSFLILCVRQNGTGSLRLASSGEMQQLKKQLQEAESERDQALQAVSHYQSAFDQQREKASKEHRKAKYARCVLPPPVSLCFVFQRCNYERERLRERAHYEYLPFHRSSLSYESQSLQAKNEQLQTLANSLSDTLADRDQQIGHLRKVSKLLGDRVMELETQVKR